MTDGRNRVLAFVLALVGVLAAGCGVSDEVIGPVGEPAAEVPVGLTEWAIVLGETGPAPGPVTLVVTNAGGTVHDLVVEGRLGRWQTPMLGPGESHELLITADAGEALHLECTVPGHHGQGMHLYLTVHDRVAVG
jgi:hypothetical protein